MLKYIIALMLFVPFVNVCSATENVTYSDIGYKEFVYDDGERKMRVGLFYPAELSIKDEASEELGSQVFRGINVYKNAQPVNNKYPLIILSHGTYGRYDNFVWLVQSLVRRGAVVVGINHPGTTFNDYDSENTSKLDERSNDLSLMIDYFTKHKQWGNHVDSSRVAVIGYSLGGATVLSSAGAEFEPARVESFCKKMNSDNEACGYYNTYIKGKYVKSKISIKDERIKAVIALDPRLLQGFTESSLKKINVPVLIIDAGTKDATSPREYESGYIKQYIPKKYNEYHVIDNANHSSFIRECTPIGLEILRKYEPEDAFICEPEKGGREKIHKIVSELSVKFLEKNGIFR